MFSINPKVDDIAEKFAVKGLSGVDILVLGTIKTAGSGCFCPESALLKSLLGHLILEKEHVVLLDMEAGLEHLGRATARSVDLMLIVVEPGRRSIDTAKKIADMAKEIGIPRTAAVLNKVSSVDEEQNVRTVLGQMNIPCIASIPLDHGLIDADLLGISPLLTCGNEVADQIGLLKDNIEQIIQK